MMVDDPQSEKGRELQRVIQDKYDREAETDYQNWLAGDEDTSIKDAFMRGHEMGHARGWGQRKVFMKALYEEDTTNES